MSQEVSIKKIWRQEMQFAFVAVVCALFCGWALIKSPVNEVAANRAPASATPLDSNAISAPIKTNAIPKVDILNIGCNSKQESPELITNAAIARFEFSPCLNLNPKTEVYGLKQKDQSAVTILRHPKSGRYLSSYFSLEMGPNQIELSFKNAKEFKEKLVTIIRK